MDRLQAIVFDVDGTLADTEEMHRQAFNRAFAEFDLDWHWTPSVYTKLLSISGGYERIRYFGRDLVADFPDEPAFSAHIAAIQRVKTRIYGEMLATGAVQLRPGVRRLIDEARRAGVKLAIATSTVLSNVRTLLDHNLPQGWPDWFVAIASGDTVTDKKPSPAVYRAVLAAAELNASACIAIEDTVNGLRAARTAGLTTIITTHYFTRHMHFPDAALVVDQFGEPQQPCRVLAGAAVEADYIDLPLLAELLCQPSRRPDAIDWRYDPMASTAHA